VRLTALFLVLAVLVGVAWASPAAAPAHSDVVEPYTQRSCPVGSARSDPVNVLFHDWGTWGRAVSQLGAHARWTDASGSGQSFVDHGTCAPMHAQRASGHGSRFHVRLRGQHWDPALGWTALAAVHHEDLVVFPVPCGHAVDANGSRGSGFDQGRDELLRAFAAAGHGVSLVWWGNTQSFKQCDGDWASSDGWAALIRLHQVSH
jgi:hypothetical protein